LALLCISYTTITFLQPNFLAISLKQGSLSIELISNLHHNPKVKHQETLKSSSAFRNRKIGIMNISLGSTSWWLSMQIETVCAA